MSITKVSFHFRCDGCDKADELPMDRATVIDKQSLDDLARDRHSTNAREFKP